MSNVEYMSERCAHIRSRSLWTWHLKGLTGSTTALTLLKFTVERIFRQINTPRKKDENKLCNAGKSFG